MLTLSMNLKLFGVLAVLYSLVFHYFYSAYVAGSEWNNVVIAAALYGFCMFGTGLFLGIKDPVRGSRMDQGFQYHLVTYIVVNAVGILWTLSGLFREAETISITSIGITLLTAFSWGVGLLVHFLVIKRSIKGISRGDVFE